MSMVNLSSTSQNMTYTYGTAASGTSDAANTSGSYSAAKDSFGYSSPKDSVEMSHQGDEAYEIIQKMNAIKPVELSIYDRIGANHDYWMSQLRNLAAMLGDIPLSDSETDTQIGMFSGTTNPYASLGKMLGLKGTFADKITFRNALSNQISDESKALTKELGKLLKKAGLEDVTKKITFAEDDHGKIVIEGNISAKQKKQLARLVNSDPELVERIKTQKARMEIANELQNDKVDLSGEKFDAARTQLLKNYLNENGVALDDIRLESGGNGFKDFVLRDAQGNAKPSDSLHDLLNAMPEAHSEITAHIDRGYSKTGATETGKEESVDVRSLLSMKRGVLSEGDDTDPGFGKLVADFREMIKTDIIPQYEKMFELDTNLGNEELRISDFTMTIDAGGRLKISDVKTKGNDPEKNLEARGILNGLLNKTHNDAAEALGMAILEDHDDEHGDVKEYRHEIVIPGGLNAEFRIESKEADDAAMREIAVLTQDIGEALGNYFGNILGIDEPFSLVFSQEGCLTLGDANALTMGNSTAIRKVLAGLNDYLTAEERGEEDATGKIPSQLSGIAEKLTELKEAFGKLHDKSRIPSGGVRFAFVP
jgi:hypothetical protein